MTRTNNHGHIVDQDEEFNREILHAKWIFFTTLVLFIIVLVLLISIHVTSVCLPGSINSTISEINQAVRDAEAIGSGETALKIAITKIFTRCSYPPLQWLDWMLASLAGVLLYIMANVANYYQSSIRSKKYRSGRAKDFIAFTPWYISTIIKAPVIALVVLVFLTNLNIEIAGLTLDFTSLNPALLLMIAFVLGFYSRVARKQLDHIVKSIFGKAYSEAEEAFTLIPSKATVLFGKTQKFSTSPYTDVTWVATAGTIQDGVYTAPTDPREAVPNKNVLITAVPTDPNIPRSTATVTMLPFNITGDKEITYGETKTYQVDPDQKPDDPNDAGVSWSAAPDVQGAAVKEEKGSLVYTAPTKEKAEAAGVEVITITAKNKEHADWQMSLEVKLK